MRLPAIVILLALSLTCGVLGFAATPQVPVAGDAAVTHDHVDMPAKTTHDHAAMSTPAESSPTTQPTGSKEAQNSGVDERLGDYLPDNVIMRDETGQAVNVRQLINMPTIIAPVYYSCPNECNMLLGTLSQVLPQVGLKPGQDFQVLAVSFDELDTPEIAAKRKKDFHLAGDHAFPAEAWTFLTGDLINIKLLTDAIGFNFERTQDGFRHSIILVAVSPGGKITRYLYGVRPLPFDIAMAATEAAKEQPGLSIKRAIAMCYTYDPQGRKYVFDFMRVAGFGVLIAIGLFVVFLISGGKKRISRPTGTPR